MSRRTVSSGAGVGAHARPIGAAVALALPLALATIPWGGCARVSAVWEAATGPLPEQAPPPTAPVPPPVAQGDEVEPPVTAPEGPARSNAPAVSTVADVRAPSESAAGSTGAPVINVFGELDGKPPRTRSDGADHGFQQHTFADEGYDADVRVDATGKWMVFSSTRHADKPEIYLQRADGTSVTQLTNDPAADAQPCFSPDGRTIAFCSTRAGSWDLYTMDPDGRNVTQVTSGPAQDMHPSFSPDGRRLVYSSIGGRSGQWELWVVDLETRERRMIGYGLFPCWSPDKSVDRIAYQRARQRGSRWFSLWTLDLVDGEARRVTEVAVSSNSAIVSPAWSPDGKRLAFATVVEPASAGGAGGTGRARGQQDVWVVDADGGNRHRLTDGTGCNLGPCWAVDGRVFFVSDRGGHDNIWSTRAGGVGGGNLPVAGRPAAGENRDPRPVAGPGTVGNPGRSGENYRTAVGSGDASEIQK